MKFYNSKNGSNFMCEKGVYLFVNPVTVDSWFLMVQWSLTLAMSLWILLFSLGSFTSSYYTLELHHYNLCSYSRFLHKIKKFAEIWHGRILATGGCALRPLLLLIQYSCWSPPSKNTDYAPDDIYKLQPNRQQYIYRLL